MRRIIWYVLTLLLCFGLHGVVSAEEKELKVIPVDAGGKMKIELSMPDNLVNSEVFIYILNPGKTVEEIEWGNQVNNTEVFSFTSQVTYKGGTESIKFVMGDGEELGGVYTCYAVGENLETATFEFTYYPNTVKQEVLQDINSDSATKETVESIYNVFSLQYIDLYNELDDNEIIAEKINVLLEKYDEIDVNNVDDLFVEALLVSSAEKGILEIEDVKEFNHIIKVSDEFISSSVDLNENGKEYFSDGVSGAINSVEDLKKITEKSIAAALVYGNKLSGNGVLAKVINEHKDFFEDNGLDINDFNSSSKDEIGAKITSEGYKVFDKMIKRINELTQSPGGSSGGSSSGSGGGRNSGSASVVNTGVTVPATPNIENVAKITFSDIGEAEWARENIERLFELGIINGKEQGIFAPNDSVTREEFVKMICGAFDLERGDEQVVFYDVPATRWSFEAITIAASQNIISGDGTNFRPADLITREDIAAILMRVLKCKDVYPAATAEKTFFDDAEEISGYAKESVEILHQNEVISGRGNNMFFPKANATRAEAVTMICRIMDMI